MPAAPQTTYDLVPAVAVEGFIADNGDNETVTRYAEAAIAQGRFGKRGTAYDQITVIAATGDVTNLLAGVTVFQTMKMPTTPHYAAKEPVRTLRKGRVWMKCAQDALTDGGPVFVIHTGADAGLPAGAVGGGTTATAVPNGAARCIKGGAPGALCLIEVNLP